MIKQIIKRDGSLQDFDFKKIIEVIDKVHKEFPFDPSFLSKKHDVINYIKNKLNDKIKTVEQIQDLVFEAFCMNGLIYPAKSFQEYRTRRMVLREQELEKTYADMDKILKSGSDENSNKDSKLLNVKRDLIAGEFYRNRLLQIFPKHIAEAHSKKVLHWHDADFDPRSTNCFTRETQFITDKGVKSFYDFNDGDNIRVLTHKGRYKNAIVRHYGKQLLNKITIQKGKSVYEYFATSNHRWILKNENITTHLNIGDRLYKTDDYFDLFNIKLGSKRQKDLWIRGFILGDGCVSYHDTNRPETAYSRIRLCGKKKTMTWIFEEMGHKVNKDNYTITDYLINIKGNLKQIPYDLLTSEDDLIAYISGFLFADGHRRDIGNNPNSSLASQYHGIYVKDKEVQQFVEQYFPSVGVFITRIEDMTGKYTNFGKRKGNPKNYNIITNLSKHYSHSSIIVKNIENTDRYEDVWCLEVEDDHSFVFPNGICTGNCSIPNVKDMLEDGFKNSNAYIGTPNSVQVASTVLMQIVFSVSNSQYGGTSIADFNELLAVYAKKNFRKNFIDAIEFYNILRKDYETTEEAVAELEKLCGEISSDNEKLEKRNPDVFAWVKKKTDKDIYDACQTFEYQTNSLTNNNQTPFVTITMTIPTSWESERVILNYFKVRQGGLTDNKGHRTIAIFPKISMFVVDGQNLKEGDKYYYILKEASKCIANTYYPDLLLYSKEDYENGTMYARMG